MIAILLIIIILFAVLFLWTWNNMKDFENTVRKIRFITIGILGLFSVTYVIFLISKIGITYPSEEVLTQVRRASVLLCVPINGYITLPHIAKIKSDIETNAIDNERNKKRIIILVVVTIIVTIFEIFYLKDFQKGIISSLINMN